MATSENLISIPGRLHSVATEHHVAGADEIYDDDMQMLQSEINSNVNTSLGEKANKEGYFPNLHAGLADNMFGSTQTNDQFMFRPTAGIQDIESGEAPLGGGTISKIEGNTVKWNQLVNPNSLNIGDGGTITFSDGEYHITEIINGAYLIASRAVPLTLGHKYYIGATFKGTISNITIWFGEQINQPLDYSSYTKIGGIVTASTQDIYGISSGYLGTYDIYVKDFVCFDLTLMFGEGNEPSTVAEFESWLETNIGLKDYYHYNEGELIPVKDYKVKSVGFNAWDEEYIKGAWNTDKTHYGAASYIAYKNIMKAPAGHKIYIKSPTEIQIIVWDCSGNAIVVGGIGKNITYTFPEDAYEYILQTDYGNTPYNNDICINLSYDDDKDGTYEPHWEHEAVIPTTKIYGKLNGSGDYVQVFPDGMKKAGSIADVLDLKNGSATKKVGDVDLGTLGWNTTWYTSVGGYRLYVSIQYKKYGLSNLISSEYPVISGSDNELKNNFGICGNVGNNTVYIGDNRGLTVEQVVSQLSGVVLYYELETPLTYTDLIIRHNGVDTPLSEISYKVDNYGTEEIILDNDTNVVSCTPKMTIKYGINATDVIAELPHSYVSGTGNQNFSEAQKTTARNNIGAISQIHLDALTRHTRKSDFDLSVLKQAVADQNLEKYGLKVGDYKTINAHDYVIAGLNCMKGSHDYTCTTNHVGLIVIPHTTQAWNVSGNTYEGANNRGAGYKNSDLHYYLKNTLLPLVETDLGTSNLLEHTKFLSNSINQNGVNKTGEATGCSSGWTWDINCKICTLSEAQVYGSTIWSSSGYDTGEAAQQLEVFQKFNKNEIFGDENPWLRDVVSSSDAAYITSSGNVYYRSADKTFYVAALILFH